MNEALILTETRGRVGVITLHRPAQLNALNDALMDQLGAALLAFDANDGVGAIVITGSARAFAAGADIAAMADWSFMDVYQGAFITRNWETIRQVRKPVLAAVAGFAMGGGCELALACDLRVAVPESRFGLPEVKRGLIASAGGLYRLPRALPQAVALEMILTGDPIPAERAHALGMVNALAPRDQLIATAQALAARITVNAPVAVRHSLSVARQAPDLSDAELMAVSQTAQAANMTSEDFKEGPRAFIEKRAPRWTGR